MIYTTYPHLFEQIFYLLPFCQGQAFLVPLNISKKEFALQGGALPLAHFLVLVASGLEIITRIQSLLSKFSR